MPWVAPGDIAIFSWQARIGVTCLRQHAMEGHCVGEAAMAFIGTIAWAHGFAEAGAPLQRTVTSASAAYGTAVWITIARTVTSQIKMLFRFFILSLFYRSRCGFHVHGMTYSERCCV